MNRDHRHRTLYVTLKQKKKLMQLLIKNPELVSFRLSQGFKHKDSELLWQDIASQCNAIPGAKKTWRQWRKTWQDIKSKVRKKIAANESVPIYVSMLTPAEREKLGFSSNGSPTHCQDKEEYTEYTQLEMLTDGQESFDNEMEDNNSHSGSESPVEEKVFINKQENMAKSKRERKTRSQHSDNCVFNCGTLAEQEQKKLEIKEDYYNFKKEYLKQKLVLLKEQTEALKNIAKELGK